MPTISSIGFIGGGRVTRLLLQGLKNKNALPGQIIVADPDTACLEKVQDIVPGAITGSGHSTTLLAADVVFLAVHPPVMQGVCNEIADGISPNSIIVSLAPVLRMDKLSGLLNGNTRLVRMIPNAPSLLNMGYNPVVFDPSIQRDEKQILNQFFCIWGEVPEVEEAALEVYAILTGMGPTYFWPQWQTLRRLGAEFGLNDSAVDNALAAMLHGAVTTLFQSELNADEVFDLIPVYPLKPHEQDINSKVESTLFALHAKLTGKLEA